MVRFRHKVLATGGPKPAGQPAAAGRIGADPDHRDCDSRIMWKSSRTPKPPQLRKFVQRRGSRRIGDHIAYVVDLERLADARAAPEGWTEDKDFDEKAALRDWPGLKSLFDQARTDGIAVCIKG
jgi:hypothetical protein